LLSDIEEEPVRQHFTVCGAITNVRIIRDQKTGAGKGFGYVTFAVMFGNYPADVTLNFQSALC